MLCQRCLDQIQWKIDYKKYKPLTVHARCSECKNKSINKAYRMLCDKCALKKIDVEVKLMHQEQIYKSKVVLVEPRPEEDEEDDDENQQRDGAEQLDKDLADVEEEEDDDDDDD